MRARIARPERLAPVPHADTHARLLEAIEAGDTAAEHAARWSMPKSTNTANTPRTSDRRC